MTIKKMMRMTIEQEQLIYEIATQLHGNAFDVKFDGEQDEYVCPLCGGDPTTSWVAWKKEDVKHAPNCLRTLAKRLLDTLQDKTL